MKPDDGYGDEGKGNRQIVASPSGINTLPIWQQQAVFGAAFGTLFATTNLLRPIFVHIPDIPFIGVYLWHPELLGPIFVAAGVSHFLVDDFLNIYPPPGTWGFWNLPGTAKFHVVWTGIAEILGGIGLIVGAYLGNQALFSLSAASLLALCFAVYPANFYMFTHGAELPKGVKMENNAHLGRFVAQIVLCGVLAGMV